MNMHDANVGDIYRDSDGVIYKVMWVCREPTVGVVSLADTTAAVGCPSREQSGGVSGLMWSGFERIYKEPRE